MLRSRSLLLICCLLVAAAAFGQARKLNLKGGGTVEGIVSEVDGKYQVQTRFGTVTLSKDQVVSIEDVLSPKTEYRQRAEKIDPNDPKEHFKLGEWAFENDLLKEAEKELNTAIELKKDYQMAVLLLREVQAKLAAEIEKKPKPGVPGVGPRIPGGPSMDPSWLVTEEEMYRIRLEELRPTDRVVVTFRDDLLRRFINSMQGVGDFERPRFAEEFRRISPARQAMYILDNINPDDTATKNDILIKSDPAFMMEFRSRVWPTIASHCGTSNCHGGRDPLDKGKLRLFNPPGRSQRIDYTNYLILEGYTIDGKEMIDRDHKESSLLLQYGLPPEQAEYNHSGPPIKAAFTSRNAMNYRRTLEWIESLKGPPHPDYDVQLRIPWAPKRGTVSLPPVKAQPTSKPVGSPVD